MDRWLVIMSLDSEYKLTMLVLCSLWTLEMCWLIAGVCQSFVCHSICSFVDYCILCFFRLSVDRHNWPNFQVRLGYVPSIASLSCIYIYIYTVSQKKRRHYTLNSLLTDFHNSFTDTFSRKFAIKLLIKIAPHLKFVATLPCEILVFANRCIPSGNWKVQLLQRETPAFISPDLLPPNSPDLNPVDYKIWGVMQDRV